MLLTVYETSFVVGVSAAHLYYDLAMCQVDGAFKVLSGWRIDECGLEELYERYRKRGISGTAGDSGLQGFTERLEAVRQKRLEDSGGSGFECLQDGRGTFCDEGGSTGMDRKTKRTIEIRQLEFDFFA